VTVEVRLTMGLAAIAAPVHSLTAVAGGQHRRRRRFAVVEYAGVKVSGRRQDRVTS
jgi:hypothetical protein